LPFLINIIAIFCESDCHQKSGTASVDDWKTDEDYCEYRNKPIEIRDGRRAIFNNVIDSKKLVAFEEKLLTPDGQTEYHLRNMYPV